LALLADEAPDLTPPGSTSPEAVSADEAAAANPQTRRSCMWVAGAGDPIDWLA
jgi:hypothetical protein